MNWKQLGLGVVLADFAALTAYAVHVHGVVGVFAAVTANAATITAFADLVIALSLVSVWMWQDARDRGVSAVPYMLLTLMFGSVGPLLYLIRREATAAPRALRARAA
jgi:hypothetical protein